MIEKAMSLTLAMSNYSWMFLYNGMPEILNLLGYLLIEQVNADDYSQFDDLKVFESSSNVGKVFLWRYYNLSRMA